MRVTIKLVNDALREEGIDGQLHRGRGYFYFAGVAFESCHSTSVYVYHLGAFTVAGWVNEAKRMTADVPRRETQAQTFARIEKDPLAFLIESVGGTSNPRPKNS